MQSTPAPFGIIVCGIGELAGHCTAKASHVLSILDPDEPTPEAFGSFGEHERLELRFHDIIDPAPGLILPQPEHVAAILAFGRDMLREPASALHLLVHCHAGMSRSTASMAILLAQAMPEQPATTAVAMMHRIREIAWPNIRMIEFGDALLGRRGELVEATHALYRSQIELRPQLAAFMAGEGRQREIDSARSPAALQADDHHWCHELQTGTKRS